MPIQLRHLLIFTIFASLSIAGFLGIALAAPAAPAVVFSGDDQAGNGGTDDPYDALIRVSITASQDNPEDWQLEYYSGGSWYDIGAKFETTADPKVRIYYWSTSGIYAPSLQFRARTMHAGEWSGYFNATLSLSHRISNLSGNYFVESFNDDDYKGALNVYWNTASSTLEMAAVPPYLVDTWRIAYSTNLLAGNDKNIVSAAIQVVQATTTSGLLRYQLSNGNGRWFGPTGENTWFIPTELVSAAQTISFGNSIGTGLYWRTRLRTSDANKTPQVYQIRLQWQENSKPQACFISSPISSDDPEQVFNFNGNCTADLQENLNQLSFKWDFYEELEGGGENLVESRGPTLGAYSQAKNFSSTSTFRVLLTVEDSYGESDDFENTINVPGIDTDLFGWLWSGNYGWTSLSCDNLYYDEEISYCPPNYGLSFNTGANTISGWAWDSNLGWMCFGSSCSGQGAPPYGSASVTYSLMTGTSTAEVIGWAKYLNFGESGWVRLNWQTIGGDDCNETGTNYCVLLDYRTRAFKGWGWAGGVNNETDLIGIGPGWVYFMGSVNIPWLETKYGSIYGRANIGTEATPPPANQRYSATYCILAGSHITNFLSETGCARPEESDYSFPSATSDYISRLGSYNLDDILSRYDSQTFSQTDIDQVLPKLLNNKVYIFENEDEEDFYIDQPLTFFNGKTLNEGGAGTVIVKGNLHISAGANSYYENAPVQYTINNLASVAWIVYGDVIIDPSVSKLVGNFLVLGDGSSCSTAGCGRFLTGNDYGAENQLVLNGLIMAREFVFQRYYKVSSEPAEQIIYDGRVLINTPPGLENVAKGLPVWREAYSTTQIEE
jgi:hypothetical protein